MTKRMTNGMKEKWEQCIGCKYNPHQSNGKVTQKDYQKFGCTVDVDEFACPRVPELYPYKLCTLPEDGLNPKVVKEDESAPLMEVYLVELYDDIDQTVRSFCVLSDKGEKVRDALDKKLKKRMYKHIRIFNIRKLESSIPGYHILAIPKKVERIVYPGTEIKMAHNLKSVVCDEYVLDIERYPCYEDGPERPMNLRVNEELCSFREEVSG